MSTTKIEFAVQMTCENCVDGVQTALKNVEGIKSVSVNLEKQSVVIDSNRSTLELQNLLETTGKKVVVKGYAGNLAGVCMLESSNKKIQGVIRFIQLAPDICLLDGTLDGLQPGPHRIYIHECGDLSNGCESVGDVYNPVHSKTGRIYGDIGRVTAGENGRTVFRLEDNTIKLSDLIGRSFVIAEENEKGQQGSRLACGIIARSAGLFQNPKTVCACDGTTIWDEMKKPDKKSSL